MSSKFISIEGIAKRYPVRGRVGEETAIFGNLWLSMEKGELPA